MMNKSTACLLLIVALLSAACGACQASSSDDLAGTQWALISLNGNDDLIGSPPTLVFDGEEISGNAGCNIYNGNYQVAGSALSLGPLVRTEMYCQEPEGVMDQENHYLEFLGSAEFYALDEGSLKISGSGNQLEFQPRD